VTTLLLDPPAPNAAPPRLDRPGLLSQTDEARLAGLIQAGRAAQNILDQPNAPTSPVEVDDLVRAVAVGRQARETFLGANMAMVFSVANRYAWTRVPVDDLVQEGFEAMTQALDSFNPELGRFSTHAWKRIWARVVSVVADDTAVGVMPAQAVRRHNRAAAIANRLHAETGATPTGDQVGAEMGLSGRAANRLLAFQRPRLVGEHDENLTRPDSGDLMSADVAEAFGLLNRLQRQVLGLRHGFSDGTSHTWEHIGQQLGISATQAARVAHTGEAILRRAVTSPDSPEPHRGRLTPAQTQRLARIGRYSQAGLSLSEVAAAMKTDTATILEACRQGGRKDFLDRFTRAELAMSGPRPKGTNVLAEAVDTDTAQRRALALKRATRQPHYPRKLQNGLPGRDDTPLGRVVRLASAGLVLADVAHLAGVEPGSVTKMCWDAGRHDLVAQMASTDLRLGGHQPVGADVMTRAARRATILPPPRTTPRLGVIPGRDVTTAPTPVTPVRVTRPAAFAM